MAAPVWTRTAHVYGDDLSRASAESQWPVSAN